MNPTQFHRSILLPGLILTKEVASIPYNDNAAIGLIAIAGQESGWHARRQMGVPWHPQEIGARGYWQFERYGAVRELLVGAMHRQTSKLCAALDVPTLIDDVFEAIAWHDLLACGMARLLLWSDPAPLPNVDDEQGWWGYYLRLWCPGMPRPKDWPENFQTARRIVLGAA